MNTGLLGKVALVGGSSSGLGKGCALALAKEGASVIICARKERQLKEAENFIKDNSGSQVFSICADLSKKEGIKRVVEQSFSKFKKIDVLVVNSGGPKAGKFFDLSQYDWEDAYRSVLYYVVELYRLIIPRMVEQKWGRIINIASLAVKEPADNLVLSNVFRSGVVSLAKSLSRELIASNVTINNICPGAFKTERAKQLLAEKAKQTGLTIQELEISAVENLPLKRYQEPEELGDLVVFLASELAKGITGTTIQIDGGIYKGLF